MHFYDSAALRPRTRMHRPKSALPAGIEINTCARMSLLLRRSPSANQLTERGQAMMKKIEGCLHCGACMKKCPYGLNTPKLLEENYEDYKNVLAGKTLV